MLFLQNEFNHSQEVTLSFQLFPKENQAKLAAVLHGGKKIKTCK